MHHNGSDNNHTTPQVGEAYVSDVIRAAVPSAGIVDPLVIVDTDIGHDPDDVFAVTIAARECPRLVVVTSDETRGRRARMARLLLDYLDRPDVPVIEGIEVAGGERRFRLGDELLAEARPVPKVSLVEDLIGRIGQAQGSVVWVGQGPMSALARVLTAAPHLAEKIDCWQMGGWFENYRNPGKASHNFDTDQLAAGIALRLCHRPRLVLSDHTNVPELEIGPDSLLYQQMMASSSPAARLIVANCTAWWAFQRQRNAPEVFRPHDPLTLSAALGKRFVQFAPESISIAGDGRIRRDPDGRDVRVSVSVDYTGFRSWMPRAVRGCA